MKALVWHGTHDGRMETVPGPTIVNPRDAIIRTTATAICDSDLHRYDGYVPSLLPGDILGHESMGEVVELDRTVTNFKVGDKVVVSFNIACVHPVGAAFGYAHMFERLAMARDVSGAEVINYEDTDAMNAEHAAKVIVEATKRGDAERIPTFPAVVASIAPGVAPGLTTDVLALVDRYVLPAPNGADGMEAERGADIEPHEGPAIQRLLGFGKYAARRFHERGLASVAD